MEFSGRHLAVCRTQPVCRAHRSGHPASSRECPWAEDRELLRTCGEVDHGELPLPAWDCDRNGSGWKDPLPKLFSFPFFPEDSEHPVGWSSGDSPCPALCRMKTPPSGTPGPFQRNLSPERPWRRAGSSPFPCGVPLPRRFSRTTPFSSFPRLQEYLPSTLHWGSSERGSPGQPATGKRTPQRENEAGPRCRTRRFSWEVRAEGQNSFLWLGRVLW